MNIITSRKNRSAGAPRVFHDAKKAIFHFGRGLASEMDHGPWPGDPYGEGLSRAVTTREAFHGKKYGVCRHVSNAARR